MEINEKFIKDTIKVIKIGLIILCIANPLLGLVAGVILNSKKFTKEYRKIGNLCIKFSLFLIVLAAILFIVIFISVKT